MDLVLVLRCGVQPNRPGCELEPAASGAAVWAQDPRHELGHVVPHARGDGIPRERREVEAKSVAYVVWRAAGLVTDDYSLAYVAG